MNEQHSVTAILTSASKSYASYKIIVHSRDARGREHDPHTVFRRYSDFHALHDKVCKQCQPSLVKSLNFPAKKAFGNMDPAVLKKRKGMLHMYLQVSEPHNPTQSVH